MVEVARICCGRVYFLAICSMFVAQKEKKNILLLLFTNAEPHATSAWRGEMQCRAPRQGENGSRFSDRSRCECVKVKVHFH